MGMGLDLFAVVPSPSWPLALFPQVNKAPPRIPEKDDLPIAAAVQLVAAPMGTGEDLFVVVPSPKAPYAL
jgi:hypothetical protein